MGPATAFWSRVYSRDAAGMDCALRRDPGANDACRKNTVTMVEHQIRFDDGAAYERMMGNWSRLAGDICLDWLGRARACDGSTSAAAAAPSPRSTRPQTLTRCPLWSESD